MNVKLEQGNVMAPHHRHKPWSVDSWKSLPIGQQPIYDDKKALEYVDQTLLSLPPLATASESRSLKAKLAHVANGHAFLLQGGDCAESFAEFNQQNVYAYFRIMLQMTTILMFGAAKPVVKVGRVAGQFSKPRSAGTEILDGKELPSYRGDMVNGMDFTEEARHADPERILKAYFQSASTLNYLRSLAGGGDASLDHVMEWNQDFVAQSRQGRRFQDIAERIQESLNFMRACGIRKDAAELNEAQFFCSHEGLLLHYEQGLTRYDPSDEAYYATSGHMLWIGDRTRKLDEAHIEFFRGIANPIGCKVGPSMTKDGLLELIDVLNPHNEPGRLTLIVRMGADQIEKLFPPLLRAVKESGRHVVWSSDPMHGNTIKSPGGYKTRPFNQILSELRSFFDIHKTEGTYAGGVHFEMTGQDVTECTGGAQAISEVNLQDRYHTHCDPRLNGSQSLEMAFLIAEELRKSDR